MNDNNVITQDDMFDYVISTIRKVEELSELSGVESTGFEALDYVLGQFPEFDINHTVEKRVIGMYNFQHENDISMVDVDKYGKKVTVDAPNRFYLFLPLNDEGQILFTGRLIHYAILKNDLEAVKYLISKGAVLFDENDKENYSQKYANSVEMLQFLNSTEQYLRNVSKRK